MSHSQPQCANVYDITPKSFSNKHPNKYQRRLPMSQRIENLRRNGKKPAISNPPAPPSTVIQPIVINTKHLSMSNCLEIYEYLPTQSQLPRATQEWIHTILRSLNSIYACAPHKECSKPTPPPPSPPTNANAHIPIHALAADLKLHHKYYHNHHFVSSLNIIFAACLQYEFRSPEFVNYISDRNVQQFKTKTFKAFVSEFESSGLAQYTSTDDMERLFVTMLNRSEICSQTIHNVSKRNIDGLDAYKPLYDTTNNNNNNNTNSDGECQYITLHSFKNPASTDENERNRVTAEFNSVCEALRANKGKIGLSIFYSVNFMDSLHHPWCYIVKFNEPTACGDMMPRLETEEKSKKSHDAIDNTETIVIDDDDDDVEMNGAKAKKPNDKEENEENENEDDDIAVTDKTRVVMNGTHPAKHTADEDLRKALEASKISHNEEQMSFHLTYDETQANNHNNNNNKEATPTDIALSDTAMSTPQRISSQPRIIPATVRIDDDAVTQPDAVEISLNCSAEPPNTNGIDLDATLMDGGEDDTFDLNYAMSDKSSPQRRIDHDLPDTVFPDTMIEDDSEERIHALPATMMVDAEDASENEQSLVLEMGEDTADDDEECEHAVQNNNNKNKENIEAMSQILSGNHDGLDLRMNLEFTEREEPQRLSKAKPIVDLLSSDDESQDVRSMKPNEEPELKMDELDRNEETEEEVPPTSISPPRRPPLPPRNEQQQTIDNLKAMGIEQGLIEFVLDDVGSNEKDDINLLLSLCMSNTDYYHKNKKKIEMKRQQKTQNGKKKRGKKRKREEESEEYEASEHEEEDEGDESDNYMPPTKRRRVSLRSGTRSRRKAKKRGFVVSDDDLMNSDSETEDSANGYYNSNSNNRKKNARSRQVNKKKKRKEIKKKKVNTKSIKKKKVKLKPQNKIKLKHTKEKRSKMFDEMKKKNIGTRNVFKTKSKDCIDFQAVDTESDSDDMSHHFE